MLLTDSQFNAKKYIIDNLSKERIILLEGAAGTGKTTLTKSLAEHYGTSICVIAPTHKAKRVIQNTLNSGLLIPITAFTVASALSKIKEHSYVGTKIYSNSTIKKLYLYTLFILDEVSMVEDNDLKKIIEYVKSTNKQLIIIGDSNQIPCPNTHFIKRDNYIEKADSFIFRDNSITKLTLFDIVRQCADSPIIQLSQHIIQNLNTDINVKDTDFQNIIEPSEIYHNFAKYYDKNNINSVKIIAYTNQAVRVHNIEIRNYLRYTEPFVIGDVLMGYTNIGYPELIIENGQEYMVNRVINTQNQSIGTFHNLSGYLLDLNKERRSKPVNNVFFINIHSSINYEFLNKLIELGEKINENRSTKVDYRKYMELKNNALFMEDIYKYEDIIYTETTFKERHPLLFINVNEILENGKIKKSLLSDKIRESYMDIITDRIVDNKIIGINEIFADKYKVIEKDIYYGYALTAHKSQGSTYTNVIVDETDFQKIYNKWNYKYNMLESRIKEKNQLRYVAYTRAKSNLLIALL